ncbi:MAG: AMP-binding protein [Deltaproteobacteria bacterium]|nr:AMP-binding protein [Deltaproteobacteria bacterium]
MSTLTTRWLAHARERKSATAVIDAHGTSSYGDVVARSMAVAMHLLRDAGAPSLAGERVGILAPPGAAFVEAFFGVLLAGGCAVVLSPIHPRPETQYFCDDAAVTGVLVAKEHEAAVAELAGVRAFPLEPIVNGALDDAAIAQVERAAKSTPDTSPALQLYTSGTTGKPKGAILTHGNLAIQQTLVGRAWGFGPNDVLLHALPLHHMHGLVIALSTCIGAGAATRMTTFDAAAIWDAMKGATVFMAVPAMYHRLFGAFDAADDATRARWSANARALRLATSGSAALPVGLADRWRELTGTIPLERFGMTELGVGLTNRLDGARVRGSVGFPLDTVETRIVGDDGKDAETGELWIRGPSVFAGYHRKNDATTEAFVADAGGGLPWFRTGDTVTRDASIEGAPFRILGRTSVDILKSGGYKISALEIEEVLREHPGVAEVAVVGLADDAWGERVVACVVRRPGAGEGCDAESLRAFSRKSLAPYKVPKDVLFLAELPKNALGKVLKPELAQVAARAQDLPRRSS